MIVGPADLPVSGDETRQGWEMSCAGLFRLSFSSTPPWIEKSVCDEDLCRLILLNPDTHEIARVNGRLTNVFVLSGDGQEVIRASR